MAMICLAIIVLQLGLHKFTKKVTNTYWYWLAWGLFCFIWLIVFRFSKSWELYAQQKDHLDGTLYGDANTISRAFMLDMCPLMGFLLTFSAIIDPTRKICRAIAPVALIGGAMIIFIQFPFEDPLGTSGTAPIWDLKWIFMGAKPNECYFFLHAVNLLFATGIMRCVPKYTWKGWLALYTAACGCYIWAWTVGKSLNCQWFVSGTHLNDWTSEGQYHLVAELLKCKPQTAMIIGIPFLFCLSTLFIVIKDFVFSRWIWKYGNAYSGTWWHWYNYDKFEKVHVFDNIVQVKLYKLNKGKSL